MQEIFDSIAKSIRECKCVDDLQTCYSMITSFRREYKYNILYKQMEGMLIDKLLNKREFLCR